MLVREPRSRNRQYLNLKSGELPFVGVDLWNGWEVSTLNENGIPVNGYIKILYPATNEYIVESKSLKLYLNSFNMTKMDSHTSDTVLEKLKTIVEKDLSALLETQVTVGVFSSSGKWQVAPSGHVISDIFDYETLESVCNPETFSASVYSESPDLLKSTKSDSSIVEGKYHSALLKSNCRVTGAPDWGDVFIYYRGSHIIDTCSILKYIISFRDECHFHEEICETIYKRFHDQFNPSELMVCCLYLRRGGIDINPIRVSDSKLLYSTFVNPSERFYKTLRQ